MVGFESVLQEPSFNDTLKIYYYRMLDNHCTLILTISIQTHFWCNKMERFRLKYEKLLAMANQWNQFNDSMAKLFAALHTAVAFSTTIEQSFSPCRANLFAFLPFCPAFADGQR